MEPISVLEDLPENNQSVLFWDDSYGGNEWERGYFEKDYHGDKNVFFKGEQSVKAHGVRQWMVTHWMPMPPKPPRRSVKMGTREIVSDPRFALTNGLSA